MSQDPRAALSALLRGADIEDHEEVLRAANAAIKADKNDDAAKHTKVVALLKLDRFDDALRFIAGDGIKLQASCALENVYALYKTGRLVEASEALKTVGLDKRSLRHVAAQVAYRAENFNEAETIYQHLLHTEAANEENDLRINSLAAIAQSEWQGIPSSTPQTNQTSLDTFEVCFNVACGEIARGRFDLAANLLQRAAMLCDNSDELSDHDKKTELKPIRAQQAFLLAKTGKLSEALDIYQSLDPTSENDGRDFAALIHNNLLSLDLSANPFLRQRKAEGLLTAGVEGKLFKNQSNILERNQLIIDLESFKAQGVAERTKKIMNQTKQPSTDAEVNSFSVMNAAAETQGSYDKEVLRKLQNLAANRPEDVGLVLTIIQIQLQQQRSGAALSILESFFNRLDNSADTDHQDVRFSPGLIALAVSLMRVQRRESSAKSELIKAARYWQGRPAHAVSSLLLESGIELMRSSNRDELLLAGSAFEKLFEEQRGSVIASAGLVASFAATDASKMQKHSAKLPPVDDLISGVDIAELFASGIATIPSSVIAKKRAATEDNSDKVANKRRRRKLPKNSVEGKKPDPERWLPLRDRSTYRPKGKKGKKRAGDSTQGGIVKEEETLELVGGGGVKVERAPASSSKKKKKGKK